jgi:hypothetical protein
MFSDRHLAPLRFPLFASVLGCEFLLHHLGDFLRCRQLLPPLWSYPQHGDLISLRAGLRALRRRDQAGADELPSGPQPASNSSARR